MFDFELYYIFKYRNHIRNEIEILLKNKKKHILHWYQLLLVKEYIQLQLRFLLHMLNEESFYENKLNVCFATLCCVFIFFENCFHKHSCCLRTHVNKKKKMYLKEIFQSTLSLYLPPFQFEVSLSLYLM